MAPKKKATEITVPILLAVDFFAYFITLGPSLAGALFWAYVFSLCQGRVEVGLAIFFAPIIFLAAFLLAAFVIRLIIPRLKPGIFRVGLNRDVIAWNFNMSLSRSGRMFGLMNLIGAFSLSKFLYWRALGAKVSYRISSSLTADLVDLPLITVGAGSTLTDNVTLSCHSFRGDRLWLQEIVIGKNVFLGKDTVIGLGTKIGDDSFIGIGNMLWRMQLPAGSHIENFEKRHGPQTEAD